MNAQPPHTVQQMLAMNEGLETESKIGRDYPTADAQPSRVAQESQQSRPSKLQPIHPSNITPPTPRSKMSPLEDKPYRSRFHSTRRSWSRRIRYFYYRFIRLRSTPEALARGLASGVFAGCFPLFGFQTLIGIAIAAIVRGNKIAAAAGTWVSNPLTYVPIYAFNLWIGQFITGINLDDVLDADLQSWSTIKTMGADILLTLMIGSAIVGLVASIIGYVFGVRLTRNFQHRRRHRRHLSHMHSATKHDKHSS